MQLKSLLAIVHLIAEFPNKYLKQIIFASSVIFILFIQFIFYGICIEKVKDNFAQIISNENSFMSEIYEYHDENNSNITSIIQQINGMQKDIAFLKKSNGKS